MPRDKATKFDKGKLRMDLIPAVVFRSLAKVFGDGAAKYGDNNYQQGILWSRYYAALLRHLVAWWDGEDKDPDSGFHHLEHVLCNAEILVFFALGDYSSFDDRPGRK